MYKMITLLFCCFGLIHCKNTSKEHRLKLNRNDFKQILADLHEYEGEMNYAEFAKDSITLRQKKAYDSIFNAHNIQEQTFLNEYKAYVAAHSVDLDSIYKELIMEFQHINDSLSKSPDQLNLEKELRNFKRIDEMN